MAKFTYTAAAGAYGALMVLDDSTLALVPGTVSATGFTMKDASGASVTVTGTGLTYGVSGLTGGTVTSLVLKNSAGADQLDVTKLKLDASILYHMAVVSGWDSDAVVALMTGKSDVIKGSALGDNLIGGAKGDHIYGGGGADHIFAMAGDDTISGGGGADVFFFNKTGDGHDVITDFTDAGTAADDRIAISKAAYASMVVTEDATGVLLTFSGSSSVHVDGWHAALVGIDDFLLS